jgi:DNA-binding beta-propeller fold protein YncE
LPWIPARLGGGVGIDLTTHTVYTANAGDGTVSVIGTT